MNIRKVTATDFETIKALNQELFNSDKNHLDDLLLTWPDTEYGEKYYKKLTTNDKYIGFLAEENAESIGYASASLKEVDYREKKYAQLDNIYLKENWRGKGIGYELLEKVSIWAKENGCNRLLVNTFSKNTLAQEFYTKTGFEPCGVTLQKDI